VVAFETIAQRILRVGAERGSAPAYAVRDDGGRWVTTSWEDYAARVRGAAKALISLGVEPGESVCIFGTNQPEWVIFDVAAMAVGAMPAGIYPTNTPDECAYVVNHSEAPVILVQNQERLGRLLAKRAEMPHLRHIVLMGNEPAEGAMTWDQFIASGQGVADDALEARLRALGPGDGGTLLYTSGTTGPPKAVVLPHRALAYMAKTLIDIIPVGPGDRVISYLPLSHIAEQIVTLLTPAIAGQVVHYEPDIRRLAETIKEVRPTAFFAVPRVWEKFYAGVTEALAEAKGAKRAIAQAALAAAALRPLRPTGVLEGEEGHGPGPIGLLLLVRGAALAGDLPVLRRPGDADPEPLRAVGVHRPVLVQPPEAQPDRLGGAGPARGGAAHRRRRRDPHPGAQQLPRVRQGPSGDGGHPGRGRLPAHR
jgi:long-chain acyl-CoA synthetase